MAVPLNPAFCMPSCLSLVLIGWKLETVHTYPTANSVQLGPTWSDSSTRGPALWVHAEGLSLGWEGFGCVAWLKIKKKKKHKLKMEFPVCHSLALRACQLKSVLRCKLWHSRRKFTQVWPGCFALAWHLDGYGREQDRVKARQVTQVPCPAVWLCLQLPSLSTGVQLGPFLVWLSVNGGSFGTFCFSVCILVSVLE